MSRTPGLATHHLASSSSLEMCTTRFIEEMGNERPTRCGPVTRAFGYSQMAAARSWKTAFSVNGVPWCSSWSGFTPLGTRTAILRSLVPATTLDANHVGVIRKDASLRSVVSLNTRSGTTVWKRKVPVAPARMACRPRWTTTPSLTRGEGPMEP